MKEILLRADDLGYTEGINLGIAKVVKSGKVQTVGLMVNLPYSKHGFELLQDMDSCLGLHVNISSGRPISDANRVSSLVDSDGLFKPSKEYNQATHDFINYDEVYEEVEAQYHFFKKLTGKSPEYIDAHAIQNQTFFKAIQDIAAKYHLLYIPMLSSTKDFLTINDKHFCFWMESMEENYDPHKTFEKICSMKRNVCEVMILHPGYIDDDLFAKSSLILPRVKEVQFVMNSEIDQLAKRHSVDFINFRKLENGGTI